MYTLNNKSYICTYRSVFLPYVIYVLSSLSHIQTATIVLASVLKNMSFEGRNSVNNVSVQQYKCVYNKSIELNHSSSVSYKNIFPSISHGTWISIAVRIWDFGFFSIRNTPRLLWSFLLLLNQPVLIVGRNAITVIKIKDFFLCTAWRVGGTLALLMATGIVHSATYPTMVGSCSLSY